MTFLYNDNEYYHYEIGICCVCQESTSGITRQFYHCPQKGIHYICNCCYSNWQRQNSSAKCPVCRANAKHTN